MSTDGMRVDLHPTETAGEVTVPDHPLLSGRRTLTFRLVQPGSGPLTNPDARVATHLTIEGSR